MDDLVLLPRAHIQNFTGLNASNVEPHWGYADRIVPCTNDPGTCAYLDVVYRAHDLGLHYVGIFWASLLALVLLWGLGRRVLCPPAAAAAAAAAAVAPRADDDKEEASSLAPLESPPPPPPPGEEGGRGGGKGKGGGGGGGIEKLKRTMAACARRYLLPNVAPRLLGQGVTRLQVAVLLLLAGYLALLSFLGIVYQTWITPVKGSSPNVYNTRTSLGAVADRLGVLAYALTPLSILLASRESLLSLLTGLPHQSFLFLHRAVGHLILLQSAVHTLGWVVVEARLYQPQPATWDSFAAQRYVQWGFVALGLLVLLWLLATPWGRRRTGYEVFRKAHYLLAMVYLGALIGHWAQLQCFLVPSLLLWGLDRVARLVRTALLHYQWLGPSSSSSSSPATGGFASASAHVTLWEGDSSDDVVVRLDWDHVQSPWAVGQHFYLCFPESTIWQSHPMTPLSLPVADALGRVRHSYVIRAKGGETKKLAQLAAQKRAALAETASSWSDNNNNNQDDDKRKEVVQRNDRGVTVSVVVTGPYGVAHADTLTPETNVLCIAGGTGITFVLPVLLQLVRERRVTGRKIELVWAVRKDADVQWVEGELAEIQDRACSHGVHVEVYITREKDHHHHHATTSSPSSSSSEAEEGEGKGKGACDCNDAGHHHPASTEVPEARRPPLDKIVRTFVEAVAQGPTSIFASGPGGMIGDLRKIVASCNEPRKVWAGDGRGDVKLVCDDRLE